MHLSQKLACLVYLNLKIVFPNTFPHILFVIFRVVAAAQLVMVKLGDTFLYKRWSIWE